jgi:predicted dehydrogenase
MKRYAFAGASGRAVGMYARPIAEKFCNTAQVVGVYDINQTRARLLSNVAGTPPIYSDFDAMLRETKPDCVIVTTVDRFHHEFIIRSLEAGCDVITEKPMTIDDEKCRAVLDAERRTGKTITVTFNYRFQPYVTRAKELIRAGAIGDVLSVDFEWLLDRSHGADYFRRWHRRMENCGGLLVHKSTHHFDLINWWIEDEPARVSAFGELRFYGPTRAERGERCSTCSYTRTCEFYKDYAHDPNLKALYFDAEHEDGYWRDGCVFSEEIDIYDTMSASVRYSRGILLSYSLNAHCAYEGWRAAINGTRGRMELLEIESGPGANPSAMDIVLAYPNGERVTHAVPASAGGHGGGDERLLQRLFSGESIPDPLGHMAGSRAGAMSILIGIAANQSIASQRVVRIADLLG